ncbi:MAG: kynureninase [Candidatus Marinimicrobia bacterium]|nr:kynureninase [Candidatus Neomarinimicrobiota bacterium]
MTEFRTDRNFAVKMDREDRLASYRKRFNLPKGPDSQDAVYFLGNSLGSQPKEAETILKEEMTDWADLGVAGHFKASRPWGEYTTFLTQKLAKIVGSNPEEIAIMNALTVNIHLMLVSFYRPTPLRHKVMMEAKAFPSDQYAVKSHIMFHGFDPETSLIEASGPEGGSVVPMEAILDILEREGDTIALIYLGGVNYYTGQVFDMETITKAAQKKGCVVGYDLAHAVGNLVLKLHDWNVDFAAWCTYKYLNAGPGSVGGIFVHERHANRPDLPRFAGWWGHNKETRFQMGPDFDPIAGAEGWQISNPPVLSTAPLLASLDIFDEVGMDILREKSIQLTGYLEFLLDQIDSNSFTIITPRNYGERGAQLSIRIPNDAQEVQKKLHSSGARCDFREPDVIRVAPVPLYNSFEDVYRFVEIFAQLI